MSEATLDGLLPADADIDLTNCDREPIHVPGGIQPHGALVVLDPETLAVRQQSATASDWFGPVALGEPLTGAAQEAVQELADELADADVGPDGFTEGGALEPLSTVIDGRALDLSAHRSPAGLIVEAEPVALGADEVSLQSRPVRRALAALDRAATTAELFEETVQQVQSLTGYDRVMLYRFYADGSGEVVAERRHGHAEPFLGLRYPATDIPEQARALYVLNRVRVLGAVGAEPVPIRGAEAPLDLRYAALRAVSPVHHEYLGNMGVAATMSVSIVRDGRLWGLIACHHDAPRVPSLRIRAAVDLVGQVVSMLLGARLDSDAARDAGGRIEALQHLIERAVHADHIADALVSGTPTLQDVVPSDGAAVLVDGRVVTAGLAPDATRVGPLLQALAERADGAFLVEIDCRDDLPDGLAPPDAAGLLAIPITPDWRSGVVWFRRETAQTVAWAGRPSKHAIQEPDGTTTLLPRASFAVWEDTVAGRCAPFEDADRVAAAELRRAVVRVVLARAQELSRLNADLERSNEELDAFTYIASHDLKEPLRGIHNYAQFVIEDYADALGDDGRAKLDSIASLSRRLDGFIDSLLEYSRVGRQDLTLDAVPLAEAVTETRDFLAARLDGAELVVGELPTLRCDRPRVVEVFANLIGNGLKYNESETPRVTVDAIPKAELSPEDRERVGAATVVIRVRDNGIGIPERYRETVFRIFKRLHGRDAFGGGSGAGLTIVERIVRRHGGVIWVTDAPDGGSAFHFTLEPRGDLARA